MAVIRSLQTRVLTITIYHMASNNIISTRKLSEVSLCGLAAVEFIRTCTQVGKMISADNFRSTEIEQHSLGETRGSSAAHSGIETFLECTIYDRFSKHVFRQAFSIVTWMRWEGGHKMKVESRAARNVYRQKAAAVEISILYASFITVRGYSVQCNPCIAVLHVTSTTFTKTASILNGGRPQVCQCILEPDSLRLILQKDGMGPKWAVVWTAALTDALKPRFWTGSRPSTMQPSLSACRTKFSAYGCVS